MGIGMIGIGTILLVLASAFLTGFWLDPLDKDNFVNLAFGIICLLGGVGAFIWGAQASLNERDELIKETRKAYYYEGFEVNIGDMDLDQFTIIYDAKENIYTLIKKEIDDGQTEDE